MGIGTRWEIRCWEAVRRRVAGTGGQGSQWAPGGGPRARGSCRIVAEWAVGCRNRRRSLRSHRAVLGVFWPTDSCSAASRTLEVLPERAERLVIVTFAKSASFRGKDCSARTVSSSEKPCHNLKTLGLAWIALSTSSSQSAKDAPLRVQSNRFPDKSGLRAFLSRSCPYGAEATRTSSSAFVEPALMNMLPCMSLDV